VKSCWLQYPVCVCVCVHVCVHLPLFCVCKPASKSSVMLKEKSIQGASRQTIELFEGESHFPEQFRKEVKVADDPLAALMRLRAISRSRPAHSQSHYVNSRGVVHRCNWCRSTSSVMVDTSVKVLHAC